MKRNGALYEQEPTGKSLPSLERGVFATPLDPILVKGIRSSHEPVLEWKDGFVCLWNESQFDQVPMKGKKKRILYFNAKVFQAENTGLTPGQIRASLEKRSKRPLEEDAREYLADLKLDATLALLRRGKAVARTEKALGEAMARHAELEIESLRALLAEYAIWRKAKTSTLDQVKSEAAAMIPELEFWNAWVSRKMWALQQEQLEGYLAALRKP
jgi:hypothetical protein